VVGELHILDIPVAHHSYVSDSQECPNSEAHRGYMRELHTNSETGDGRRAVCSPPTVKRLMYGMWCPCATPLSVAGFLAFSVLFLREINTVVHTSHLPREEE